MQSLAGAFPAVAFRDTQTFNISILFLFDYFYWQEVTFYARNE